MLENTNNKTVGEIDISISQDNMTAYLCLSPEDINKTYDIDYLKALLRESGIVSGIREDVLEQIVSEKRYNEQIAVALGTPAQDGKDGWFEFLFDINIDSKPKILKDGSVDYGSCGTIPKVDEGQEIVHYHPATGAQDGIDVCGGILVGKNGKDLARLRGKGFILSEDNLLYTARFTGKATYINEVLSVDKELTIDGDVSYTTTGNITFVNDIHIRGNVLTGMTVISEKGNITVDGYVEAAVLVAKKDVILKNGMQGNGQGKVTASGSVSGKYFEHTFIDCDGDVNANSIMNCQINAGQDVKVSGRFGAIIGGCISAMRSVDSMIIGNMAEVRTDIYAGIEGDLYALLSQHKRILEQLQDENETIINGLKKIDTLLETDPDEELRTKKMLLLRAKIEKESRINEVIKRKQETLEQMEKANDAKVTIVKRVFPGTRITINGMKVIVKEEIANVEYARRGSGIISYNPE